MSEMLLSKGHLESGVKEYPRWVEQPKYLLKQKLYENNFTQLEVKVEENKFANQINKD